MKIKLFDFYNDDVTLEDIEREVNKFCEGKKVIDIKTTYSPETNHEYCSYTITVLYEEATEATEATDLTDAKNYGTLDINVYDMLVFEDEAGSIYQDCVCSINNDITSNGYSEPFHRNVVCERFIIDFTDRSFDKIDAIRTRESILEDFHQFKLKEVWTRVDEDTYKKKYIWSDELKQIIPYRKGYIRTNNKQE